MTVRDVLTCLIVAVSAVGCAGVKPVDRSGPALLVYPKDAARGETLDIVVVQHSKHIAVVNLTAHRYEHVQLWLNQQYGAEIKQIKIGTDNRYSLLRFINEHGEHVPVAQFLAPDLAAEIVSAELLDPATGMRHVLTVRQGK